MDGSWPFWSLKFYFPPYPHRHAKSSQKWGMSWLCSYVALSFSKRSCFAIWREFSAPRKHKLLQRTGRGVSPKKSFLRCSTDAKNRSFTVLHTLPRLPGKWHRHPGRRSRIARLLSMFHHQACDAKLRRDCELNPITPCLDPAEGSRGAVGSSSNNSYSSCWALTMCQALCWEPYIQYLL